LHCEFVELPLLELPLREQILFALSEADLPRALQERRQNVVGFDLTGLMCGSEGLLGIITEATLKLLPMPEATATVRASFASMEAACEVLTKFTPEGLLPMAMEVIDKNCLGAIEENFAFGLSKDANAILIVAVDGFREEVERKKNVVSSLVCQALRQGKVLYG